MKIKKAMCLLVLLCMVLPLCGCQGQTPGAPQEGKASDFVHVMRGGASLEAWHENNVISRVVWQKLKLSEAHAEAYPALSAAFDRYNEESLTEAKAQMYELDAVAEELAGDEFNPVYCTAEAKLYRQRTDAKIVSLLEGVEKYTGGIHPDYFWHGINYDAETGESLLITDVLTDTKTLPAILEKKITEKYSGVTFFNLQDTFNQYKPEAYTWTMDYQGITFWFAPYEIAAYAVGTLSAKLWFDEFPELFCAEYTLSPESYVLDLPVGIAMDFDLQKVDGKADSVYTERVADRYGSYNMLSVVVNGKTCTDEINYAYDFDVYLAKIGDKNYLYSESVSDNDYHMFSTWDINGDTVEIAQSLSGTQMGYVYIEEGYESGTNYQYAISDPASFVLATRFEILGTRGAVATYKISEENGAPAMTDAAYTFTYGHNLKTAMPLTAKLLPDLEEIQIPAGTVLVAYQTDGMHFVDVQTEDGKALRLEIDASAWPRTVNGMPEEKCFETLLYAG